MSRSDKKGSLEKGAGCEQREQTEGLKVTHVLFKFHITPRNPSGLPCGNPPPFSREAESGLKVTLILFKFHTPPQNPSGLPCGNPPPFSREAMAKMTEGFI